METIQTTYFLSDCVEELNELDEFIQGLGDVEQQRHRFEVHIPPRLIFYVDRAYVDANDVLRTGFIKTPVEKVDRVVHICCEGEINYANT